MGTKTRYNYSLIFKNLFRYLPAKLLVILCSFLIIPIFTNELNVKEVSIYLLSIQMLNLFCTFSSDWIAKAVLRFYVKYKLEDRRNEFISAIIFISAVVYLLILIIYFITRNIVYDSFLITNLLFGLVILLIIPCGIRQVLYQIVRIKNKPTLYTLSIVLYNIIFVVLFLCFVNVINNALSIIIAMFLAIVIIDVYLYKSLFFEDFSFCKFNKDIILNVLKYAIPLIFTNVSYWLLLKYPMFIFQKTEQYLSSASLALSATIVGYIITILASLFLFVAFPIFVKDFEMKKNIKHFFTNFVQSYFYLLLPILATCILYPNEIIASLLPNEYSLVAHILPVVSITFFLHEFLKIINIKYHLKNKTYLEMIINVSIIILALISMPIVIEKHSIIGSVYLILFAEILLFIANISLKIKDIDYIDYKNMYKTIFYLVCIIAFNYILISQLTLTFEFSYINKILLFLAFTYFFNYCFRKKILF